jgi:hypothetical protein
MFRWNSDETFRRNVSTRMSLHAHLIHSCTIQRQTAAPDDPYHQSAPVYGAHLEGVPCRLVTKAQRVVSDDRTQFVVVTVHKLLVPAGTDVTEDDRVVSVTLEDGVQKGPFGIGALLPRRARALHHVTLELEDVT